MGHDYVSAFFYAIGQIAGNTLLYAAILFPFVFAALVVIKRLAQIIFPAPKPQD